MRKILLLLIVTIAASMYGAVVIDNNDSTPVNAASFFSAKGHLLGISDLSGNVPALSSSHFPITVKAMGYEPYTLTELQDTIRLIPQLFPLNEVTVTNDKAGVRLLCYIRESSSGFTGTDSMLTITEYMADYVLPFSSKVKKFKSQTSPRILARRSVGIFSFPDKQDSVAYDMQENFSLTTLLTNMKNLDYTETPALADKTVGNDTVMDDSHSIGRRIAMHKNGATFTVQRDMIYGAKNHIYSPAALKLLGMSIDFSEAVLTDVFAQREDGKYSAPDLARSSLSLKALAKGKMFKWLLKSREPIEMNILIEIVPVAVEYVSPEESREILKSAPDNVTFILPEGMEPVEKVINRRFQTE